MNAPTTCPMQHKLQLRRLHTAFAFDPQPPPLDSCPLNWTPHSCLLSTEASNPSTAPCIYTACIYALSAIATLHLCAGCCAAYAVQVRGFNVRSWMRDNKKKVPAMLEALGKLVAAGKLTAAYTE